MQDHQKIKLTVETDKSVLSSKISIYKTEKFINDTKHILSVDKFITKLSEGILLNLNLVSKLIKKHKDNFSNIDCYKLTTSDRKHSFCFRFGYQTSTTLQLNANDIVFFNYINKETEKRRNDQRLLNYLSSHNKIDITLQRQKDLSPLSQFQKLYRLSHAEHVNFPLLSKTQQEIVTTEDQNILVQGVAGSGKTNICINKILFTACRAYAGRILYSTFSRGLLIDTKQKVQTYIQNLVDFVQDYTDNKIIFIDSNHKKAIENKLGIYFSVDSDSKIIEKINEIIQFLNTQVDYYLLEDLYKKHINNNIKIATADYFLKHYVRNIKNHQLAVNLQKLKHLSYEVIFREIYGLIHGSYSLESPQEMLTSEQYIELRKESFSKRECQTIYLVAKDYYNHLKSNSMWDNNLISKMLLENLDIIPKYSLAIIDEIQDMTEINLYLIRNIARKLFCVGDALQMINPSYFSFSYLKRLLYQKDIVTVAQLTNNYRNSQKIEHLIDELGKINIAQFGTHSFVLKGESIDNEVSTSTIFINEKDFINAISTQKLDNYTVIVSNIKEKERLRTILKNQEILTVAEIKGLERDTVILYNVLSDNVDKWQQLERTLINRKTADENSVYRYYFNLFYVGISRAKNHLYVVEEKNITLFDNFLNTHFETLNKKQALQRLTQTVHTIEDDQEEVLDRIRQFISLGQYDNARFAANRIIDDIERTYHLNIIEISENHIHHGDYRQAGIAFWEKNMLEEAKQQFKLSNDQALIDLIDACKSDSHKGLDIDILQFYLDVQTNELAREIILQTVKNDLSLLKENNRDISNKLRKIKEKKYGQ